MSKLKSYLGGRWHDGDGKAAALHGLTFRERAAIQDHSALIDRFFRIKQGRQARRPVADQRIAAIFTAHSC
ncbi:MAG: hypothetical protein R3192_17995 [Woeseiaceae bacterium]|nr:hypothetical protein [Woeseiaceae bacterium]